MSNYRARLKILWKTPSSNNLPSVFTAASHIKAVVECDEVELAWRAPEPAAAIPAIKRHCVVIHDLGETDASQRFIYERRPRATIVWSVTFR
jgi:hypothetical protein